MLDEKVTLRIERALNFEEPDRVPSWHGNLRNDAIFDYYAPGEANQLKRSARFHRALGSDLGTLIPGGEDRQFGGERKNWRGPQLLRQFSGYTDWQVYYPIDSIAKLRSFSFSSKAPADLRSEIPHLWAAKVALEPRTLFVPNQAMALGLFCHKFTGLQFFCEAIHDAPEEIDRLLREVNCYVAGRCKILAESGLFPLVVFSDDLGGKGKPIFSPKWLRKHYWPLVEEAAAPLRAAGVKIIHDLDGYVEPLLEDMLAAGCQGLAWIDIAAGMNLAELKAKYRRRMILVGGIPSGLFTSGRPEDIVRVTREAIRTVAPGGGYFICPDGDIDPLASVENFQTFIKVIQDYGEYPIRA
jgi:hypothetical protein